MVITKWLLAATVAAGLAVTAVPVSATTLTGFTDGTFRSTNIGFGTNSCRFDAGGGANSGVAWGDPNSCPDNNGIGQDDSTLGIETFNFSQEITGPTLVQIGQINWFNEANTAAVNFAAIADINLTLTSPVAGSVSEALAFNIDNTPNNPADNILALTFSDFGLSLPTGVGDLTLLGFSFDLISPISGETLVVSNVTGGVRLDWTNPENNISTLGIYASFDGPAPIPLPAAGWLMLAGLGGLAAVRRRRKAA